MEGDDLPAAAAFPPQLLREARDVLKSGFNFQLFAQHLSFVVHLLKTDQICHYVKMKGENIGTKSATFMFHLVASHDVKFISRVFARIDATTLTLVF